MHLNKHKLMKFVTTLVAVSALGLSVWVMLHHMGLAPGLDFAAGAYYYADIPEFEKYMHEGAYSTDIPQWVIYALFFAWGYLMWRLWLWVERRGKKVGN